MLPRGDRYSRGAIAFHWTIAALVILNILIGLGHEWMPRNWAVMPLHKSFGITVLVLSIARLGWRMAHRPPQLPAALPAHEKLVARGVHWIFYALILVLPLSGWAMSSNPERPRPVSWFGLFDLPSLPVDKAIAGLSHEMHEVLGIGMAVLAVLHIAAAIRHHFLLRDGVLASMAPWVRPRG